MRESLGKVSIWPSQEPLWNKIAQRKRSGWACVKLKLGDPIERDGALVMGTLTAMTSQNEDAGMEE